jgi:hypothetical protein
VRCATHGWDAYVDQGGGVASGAWGDQRRGGVGRRERFERAELPHVGVNALMRDDVRAGGVPGFGWEDYLKHCEAEKDRQDSQLEAIARAVLDLQLGISALESRLDAIKAVVMRIEDKR